MAIELLVPVMAIRGNLMSIDDHGYYSNDHFYALVVANGNLATIGENLGEFTNVLLSLYGIPGVFVVYHWLKRVNYVALWLCCCVATWLYGNVYLAMWHVAM